MKTSLNAIGVVLVATTAFGVLGADWDHYQFGYKYLTRDTSQSAQPGPCEALTAKEMKKITKCRSDRPLKTCPKCPVDRDVRRCRLDDKYSINIFPDKAKCETNRYDENE